MRAAIPAGRGGATGQAATATPAPMASVAMAVEAAMRPSDTPGRRGQTGGSALAHDRLRGLVVAQAEEARVAQAPGAGPLGEADLGDELRLDPGHVALADRAGVGERRVVPAQRAQPGAEVAQGVAVEAGADLAGVAQRAVVVVAEQERAELGPRPARRGEPADDELLALLALELEPVARAAVGVGAVGALGDQPLPPLAARLRVEDLPALAAVRGQADRVLEVERRAQEALAGQQPAGAHVAAVEPEDVEDVEEHRHAAVAALREPREARLRAGERDDLAVEREALAPLPGQRARDLGVARVEREVVAREEPHGSAVAHGDAADAVELALEDPRRVAEARVGERRLHRGGAGRGRSGPHERALVRIQPVEPVGRRAGHAVDPSRATSSIVRPDFTERRCVRWGLRRAAGPSARRFISSHCGLRPAPVRWSVQPPRSFSPSSQKLAWPASSASPIGRSSSSVRYVPASQMITAPVPRPPPITPSKSPCASEWSSTSTASRFSRGSVDGPFGTAQERRTPSTSRRKS